MFTDNLEQLTDIKFYTIFYKHTFEENLKIQKMENKTFDKRIILGLLILAAGILILGSNLGFIPYSLRELLIDWKMVLIVIGLVVLLASDNKAPGIILIAIGGYFYLPEFFDFRFDFRDLFWPMILITVGLIFIFRKKYVPSAEGDENDTDFIDDLDVFGGGDKIINSQNFKGGKITCVFGGSNINLTPAKLAPGMHSIDVFMVFGGTKLIIPSDWNVKVEVISIFGGFADKRQPVSNSNNESKLIIKGFVVFGGGEIKSF